MNDNENNNKHEEFLKLLEKNLSSGKNTSEDKTATHSEQPGQVQRSSIRQADSHSNSVPRQSSAPVSEYPASRSQPSKEPGKNPSPKPEAAKKRRQLRMIVITVISAVAVLFSILLAVKFCGGDGLKGTWDLDGVTVYQFDGNGNGSLNLPDNTYPFEYEINKNELNIDFESDAARDVTYIFTIDGAQLTLVVRDNKTETEKEYKLTKIN